MQKPKQHAAAAYSIWALMPSEVAGCALWNTHRDQKTPKNCWFPFLAYWLQ